MSFMTLSRRHLSAQCKARNRNADYECKQKKKRVVEVATREGPTGALGSVQDLDKDDWYCVGLDSQCGQSRRSVDDDDVRCRAHQLFCQRMRAINVARGPVIVRLDVASFRPTQTLQRLAERRNARLCLRIALGKAHQHADPPHPLALLCTRRERPRPRRAAEQRDERATLDHSITSSARPSTASGNERPSSFAVLRLMISSIFVDWETGSSAGFSPLRIFAE